MHVAVLYSSPNDLAAALGPPVAAAEAAGVPGVLILRPENRRALEAWLGRQPSGIELADPDGSYTSPVKMLAAWSELVSSRLVAGRGRMLGIGEIPWERYSPRERLELVRNEAVYNLANDRVRLEAYCVYHRSLDRELLRGASQTHGHVHDGCLAPSDDYRSPEEVFRALEPDLTVPGDARHGFVTLAELAELRRQVTGFARREGASAERAAGLALAASEVAANAFQHGRVGRIELFLWADDDFVFCQVDDAGAGLAEPLAGYLPPGMDEPTGRGLWLARHACDHVELAARHPRGTAARVALRREAVGLRERAAAAS